MEQPIRILEVVSKMNRAGTETMLMNFYRHMDRTQIQMDFAVCTEEKCDYDDEISALGGRIIRYPRYTGINHLSYKKWWNIFLDTHKEYQVIHGHIGSTAAIYLNIAKKRGLYTIAHSHGTKGPLNLYSVLYHFFSYRTRFIADYFFGCSKQALIDRYGKNVANSSQARVLNNAIDAAAYVYDPRVREIVRKDFHLEHTELVLGTVGRLSPQKNPLMTIRILSELKKNGLQFKFLWVGTGEMKDTIEAAIRENNLVHDVIMLGVRNDVQRILQAIDIFIFPSVWEGLGIVAIESQASGLPTLCSDQVPAEAKITDLCEYIPLNNTSSWCEAVQRISQCIKSKNYYRRNTYSEVVKAGFEINDVARWLQDFYINHYIAAKP